MTKKIEVKVIFLKKERDISVLEKDLLGIFKDVLGCASDSRCGGISFSYDCALKKLLEEGEIEIKLKCKKEKYICDLDKEQEERLKIARKNI